jgi:hypothetical protein
MNGAAAKAAIAPTECARSKREKEREREREKEREKERKSLCNRNGLGVMKLSKVSTKKNKERLKKKGQEEHARPME